MSFINKMPEWKNEGTEPSEELKSKGFTQGYKPPAGVFNHFWSLVTKAITELQNKVFLKSGGKMTGSIDMSGSKITNLSDPSADTDAANKKYADKAHLISTLRATSEVEGYLFLAKAQHTGWGSSSVLLSLQNGYSGKKFNSLVSIQVNGNSTELFTDFVQISGADITNRLLYVKNPDDQSISYYIQKDTYMTIYASVLSKYGNNITVQNEPTYETELNATGNAIYETGGARPLGKPNIVVNAIRELTDDGTEIYKVTDSKITELYNGLEITIIPNAKNTTTSPRLKINDFEDNGIRLPLSFNVAATTTITANYFQTGRPITLKYHSELSLGIQGQGAWLFADRIKTSAQDLYGDVPIESGGTGASTKEEALENLGLGVEERRIIAYLSFLVTTRRQGNICYLVGNGTITVTENEVFLSLYEDDLYNSGSTFPLPEQMWITVEHSGNYATVLAKSNGSSAGLTFNLPFDIKSSGSSVNVYIDHTYIVNE